MLKGSVVVCEPFIKIRPVMSDSNHESSNIDDSLAIYSDLKVSNDSQ